jgi:hypothetical protein
MMFVKRAATVAAYHKPPSKLGGPASKFPEANEITFKDVLA